MNNFKFKHIAVIIFTSLIITIFGCEETENKIPTCLITTPNNGNEFNIGTVVTISVNADDADGNITEVRFYVDDSIVKSSNSFPYNYEWNTTEEETGSHTLKATAKDNAGETITDEITVLTKIGSSDETGTVSDYDRNTYNTIKIGNQWWMAENLKTTHYANGTPITLVQGSTAWGALSFTDEAYCYFDIDTYGALYTWTAAMNGATSSIVNPSNVQGACPDGWHLPSDAEWKQLEMYLGMSQIDADEGFYRGTNEGSKLAGNAGLWTNGILENDAAFGTSGFLALPIGGRDGGGTFVDEGYCGFWSATEYSSSEVWVRTLSYNYSYVFRGFSYKYVGYSVRCLKD